jgi:hypothetical protein
MRTSFHAAAELASEKRHLTSTGVGRAFAQGERVNNAVHRMFEQRASASPEAVAILEGSRTMTYRDLNLRANAVARCLADRGLKRGSLAMVRMPRGGDLAVVLLAVLKAGASYAWIEPGSTEDIQLPARFCILRGRDGNDDCYLALDIDRALQESASRVGPNLPVLTRGSDVACVLPDVTGRPHVLVPHETICALPHSASIRRAWDGTAGALDLWVGLMSGATLSLGVPSAITAAA